MELLKKNDFKRDNKWTESIAVGDKRFVEKIKEQLGFRARGRKQIISNDGAYQLREKETRYGHVAMSRNQI